MKVKYLGQGLSVRENLSRRDRVMCSIRCTGDIGLQLEFGSSSDVRVSARIGLRENPGTS